MTVYRQRRRPLEVVASSRFGSALFFNKIDAFTRHPLLQSLQLGGSRHPRPHHLPRPRPRAATDHSPCGKGNQPTNRDREVTIDVKYRTLTQVPFFMNLCGTADGYSLAYHVDPLFVLTSARAAPHHVWKSYPRNPNAKYHQTAHHHRYCPQHSRS